MCVCSLGYSSYKPDMLCCFVNCALFVRTVCVHIILQTAQLLGNLLNLKCISWFYPQILSKIFLILRRIQPAKSQIHIGINLKYPLLLSEFKDTWLFPKHYRKIFMCEISWKSVQSEPSCSIWTDRRDKLNGRFSQYYEGTEKIPGSGENNVVTLNAISQEYFRL